MNCKIQYVGFVSQWRCAALLTARRRFVDQLDLRASVVTVTHQRAEVRVISTDISAKTRSWPRPWKDDTAGRPVLAARSRHRGTGERRTRRWVWLGVSNQPHFNQTWIFIFTRAFPARVLLPAVPSGAGHQHVNGEVQCLIVCLLPTRKVHIHSRNYRLLRYGQTKSSLLAHDCS